MAKSISDYKDALANSTPTPPAATPPATITSTRPLSSPAGPPVEPVQPSFAPSRPHTGAVVAGTNTPIVGSTGPTLGQQQLDEIAAARQQKIQEHRLDDLQKMSPFVAQGWQEDAIKAYNKAHGLETVIQDNAKGGAWTPYDYLPNPDATQANAAIALAHALGNDSTLIRHPQLLVAAAYHDMKQSDMRYMATMSDIANAYRALMGSQESWHNASQVAVRRMQPTGFAQLASTVGPAVMSLADSVRYTASQAERGLGWLLGESVKPISTDIAGTPTYEFEGSNMVGDTAFKAIQGLGQQAGNLLESATNIQHSIRWLHHIEAKQGKAAAAEAAGMIVANGIMLHYAAKGLGLTMKGLETAGLRREVEKTLGKDVAKFLEAPELRAAAYGANDAATHMKWLRMAHELILKQPDATRRNLLEKLSGFALRHEKNAPADALESKLIEATGKHGAAFDRFSEMVGKGLRSTARGTAKTFNFSWNHYKVPINFQAASWLAANNDMFGFQKGWKDAWELTKDGEKYRDPNTGRKVSLGRDLASVLGQKPGSFTFNALSGVSDMLTMFNFDPTIGVMKALPIGRELPALTSKTDVYKLYESNPDFRKMAEYIAHHSKEANTKFRKSYNQLMREYQDQLLRRYERQTGDKRLARQKLNLLLASGQYKQIKNMIERRVWAKHADQELSSAARIVRVFPQLANTISPDAGKQAMDLIHLLTQAETPEKVVDVFAKAIENHALANPNRLPSYSRFTEYKDTLYEENKAKRLADTATGNSNRISPIERDLSTGEVTKGVTVKKAGMKGDLARGAVSLKPSYFDPLKNFSNKEIKIGDPRSLDIARRAFLAMGIDPHVVDWTINRLANTNNIREWRTVFHNAIQDTFHVHSEAILQDLVREARLNPAEAVTLRDTLEKEFAPLLDEYSNVYGGGGPDGIYSGANINRVVNREHPHQDPGTRHPTAGLLESHEHYITLPNYHAVDDYIQYVTGRLSRENFRSLKGPILDKAAELIGAPFEREVAQIVKRQTTISDEIVALNKKIAEDEAAGLGKNMADVDRVALLNKHWNDLEAQAKIKIDLKNKAVADRIGGYTFFEAPEKYKVNVSEALHNMQDFTRKWLIDNYFRKMALATGAFAARVASSEAIATMFRLGGKEFGKALLADHVARGIEAAQREAKQTVGEELERTAEHGVIMTKVHDVLQQLNSMHHEFMKGVARGGGLGKMVERLAQDFAETGGSMSGLGAAHVDGRDFGIGGQLAKGEMPGPYAPSNGLDQRTMQSLSTQLYEVASSPVGRKASQILYKFMSPSQYKGMSLGWRIREAEESITYELNKLMKQDPKTYDNMIRKASINVSTLKRIEREVLSTPGITDINSVEARQLMSRKMKEVDSSREWANSLIQHILWLTHGRGTGEEMFSLANMTDRVFHRHILRRLANNSLPRSVDSIQQMYIRPTLEQARIRAQQELAPRGTAGAKFPGKAPSFHDVMFNSDKDFSRLETLTPEERNHFGLPAHRIGPGYAPDYKDVALQDMSEKEISDKIREKYTPEKYSLKTRAGQKVTRTRSVAESYNDRAGQTNVAFPGHIPVRQETSRGLSSWVESLFKATVDRASNAVHDRFSQPIIDHLSRQPLYAMEYNLALDRLEKWPGLDPAVARNIARQQAVIKAISFVHNPADRFVFEQWARGFAPFWFAKNQALRRAGRFAIENPARFQAYVRAMLAMQHFGADTMANLDNQNGILMPGSNLVGRYATNVLHSFGWAPAAGVPIGMTGSLSSLASVFPWTDPTGSNPGSAISLFDSVRPDFGPMVALPLRKAEMSMPHNEFLRRASEEILGKVGSQASMFQMLVPNTEARAAVSLSSFAMDGRNTTTTQLHALEVSLYMDAVAQENRRRYLFAEKYVKDQLAKTDPTYAKKDPAAYMNTVRENARYLVETGIIDNGKVLLDPIKTLWDGETQHRMINESKKGAIALYMARSIAAFFSPLSPQLTSARPQLEKLVRDAQIAGLDSKKSKDLFMNNLDAIWFAAHSTAAANGLPLQATVDMARIDNANLELFTKYPAGALAFVPHTKEGAKFDSSEYHNQLLVGMRTDQSMGQIATEMRRREGNWYAYEFLPKFVKEQAGDDPNVLSQLKREYRDYNTQWAKSQGDTKVVRVAAMREVRQMLDPKIGVKDLASREGFKETVPLVKQIVKKYDELHQSWEYAGTGWKQSFEDDWNAYLLDFVKKHPVMTSSYISIFRGLKLSDNA